MLTNHADKRHANQLLTSNTEMSELVLPSETGQRWVAHLECYPEEQLLRVRKQGGGTVLLDGLNPREVALARLSAVGLRVVVRAHLKTAGL